MSTHNLKPYLLYTTLLFTLGAALYFIYLDYFQVKKNEALSVTKHKVNRSEKLDSHIQDMKLAGLDAIAVKRIDIFEVYMKPVIASQKKEDIQQQVKVKETVINSPPPELPPPVISTPAIQLKYIGKIKGDEGYQVFVGFNGKSHVVKEGDVIQQVYKIEKITPPTMTITYIPIGIVQTMPIGEPG